MYLDLARNFLKVMKVMPLHDFNNVDAYQQLCRDMDTYVADAVEQYIHAKQITDSTIREAWNELVPKLRSG